VTFPDPAAPTDPLGRALQLLRMDGAFYCASHLSAPWGMSLPAMPGYVWFHAAITGSFTLHPEEGPAAAVSAGELALVPHGTGHRLCSASGVPTPDILSLEREIVSDRYETLRYGGGGPEVYLICGAVRLEHPAAHHLLRSLPPTIVVSTQADDTEWLHSTLRLLGSEARQARPGSEAVITRLADIIVIQAIRAWLDADPAARKGWLGALRDPYIGQAIALVHADPGNPWTVASLASRLSMSRSAFAARFTELVGETAMAYVTGWRMHVAFAALQSGAKTVGQLSDELGYRSEAAFARAFKRVMGMPPGAVRRGGQRGAQPANQLAKVSPLT
jgi:AraC-like DNA-binding protein